METISNQAIISTKSKILYKCDEDVEQVCGRNRRCAWNMDTPKFCNNFDRPIKLLKVVRTTTVTEEQVRDG